MNDTPRNGSVLLHVEDAMQRDHFVERRQQHCRVGMIEGYDPVLDARADELEALRCLAYLLRNDVQRPERANEYLDQVDTVLDRMVDELKKSA
jgi:hypothetical protein